MSAYQSHVITTAPVMTSSTHTRAHAIAATMATTVPLSVCIHAASSCTDHRHVLNILDGRRPITTAEERDVTDPGPD